MSTQARLPGTLPTPAEARQRLKDATAAEANARNAKELSADRLKDAKDEAKAAEAELVEAERLLIDAVENSDEARAAEADQAKAWKRLRLAEKGIKNLTATHGGDLTEWKATKARLFAAREDLEAIRQGRRKS